MRSLVLVGHLVQEGHVTRVPTLKVGVAGRESGGRREEEGSCPYLDLHIDLKVCPVDDEQCAVRVEGAHLPGMIGHVPVPSRRTSGEKEETWQEKVLLSIDEGTGDCISFAHPLKSHSQTLSVGCAHVSLTLQLFTP